MEPPFLGLQAGACPTVHGRMVGCGFRHWAAAVRQQPLEPRSVATPTKTQAHMNPTSGQDGYHFIRQVVTECLQECKVRACALELGCPMG